MSRKLRVPVAMLLVVVMLLMCSVSAFAAAPTITRSAPVNVYPNSPQVVFSINYGGSPYDWQMTRTNNGVVEPVVPSPRNNLPVSGSNVQSNASVYWDYLMEGDYENDRVGYEHTLSVTSEGTTVDIPFYINWMYGTFDQFSDTPVFDPTVSQRSEPVVPEIKVYEHKNVCSVGPRFRDISPDETDKWFMFTAIDLSQDGKQVYPMIAGNWFIIGKVTVLVDGDNVTVTYRYFNTDIKRYREFFTFFPDYDSVPFAELADMTNDNKYGKALSIEKDLGGDTSVLLFTRNTATFTSENKAVTRYWHKQQAFVDLRAMMLEMIGKTEVAAK